MKPQEIRDLTQDEIVRKIKELKDNLFKLKVKLSTKQLEKTHQIRFIKKDIARLMTILNEKKKLAKEVAKK
jgi:large subunit ribosomal protein L29